MSSADRVKYFYVPEVSAGVTPASAAFKRCRITGESLKVNFENEQSKELRDDRTEPEQIIIGESVAGDLNHEFLFDAQQDFIAAVLGQAAWTVDGSNPKKYTVQNGVAVPFFSVLKQFADLSAVNHLFKGLVINTWNLNIQKKSILTGSFGLMGMGFVNGAIGTILSGSPTYAAASNTDPINGSSHITSLKMNGASMTAAIDKASLSITNNYRAKEQLGSLAPVDYTQGRIQITGSMDLYFKTEVEFNMYKSGTPFSFEIDFTDNDTNQFSMLFDRCKFEDMEVVASGTNQDVIAKGKWRATYDPVNQRVCQFTTIVP